MAAVSDISPAEAAALIDELTAIVARACGVIRNFAPGTVGRQLKADQSPVTAADEASEAAILEGLAKLMPGVPVVSEEKSGREAAPVLGGSFLMVDPLDGTKEFLAGRDEFTVNLAVLERPHADRRHRGGAGARPGLARHCRARRRAAALAG